MNGWLDGLGRGLLRQWLKNRIPPARRLRLRHRSVFILPSRAGFGVLLLFAIMLIGAINYQNSLVYALVFLLGSLFWVSLHHTYRNLAGLELRATGSRSVFAGEAAPFTLTLSARSHDHQSLKLCWPGQQAQRVDVSRGEDTVVTLYHTTERRGWFRPDRLRVETRFPLGWFVAWSLIDLKLQTLVYPQPIEAPLPRAGRGGEGEGEEPQGEGVEDFQGLRHYQPGDSKRRLDWRAWSRGQGLHSKVFAEPLHNSLWLRLEAAPGADLDQRLGCLAGWILHLEKDGQPYGLDLPGRRHEPGIGEVHRDACLQTLALYGAAP